MLGYGVLTTEARELEQESAPRPATPAAGADPWAGLLQTGLALLEQLASAAQSGYDN